VHDLKHPAPESWKAKVNVAAYTVESDLHPANVRLRSAWDAQHRTAQLLLLNLLLLVSSS